MTKPATLLAAANALRAAVKTTVASYPDHYSEAQRGIYDIGKKVFEKTVGDRWKTEPQNKWWYKTQDTEADVIFHYMPKFGLSGDDDFNSAYAAFVRGWRDALEATGWKPAYIVELAPKTFAVLWKDVGHQSDYEAVVNGKRQHIGDGQRGPNVKREVLPGLVADGTIETFPTKAAAMRAYPMAKFEKNSYVLFGCA